MSLQCPFGPVALSLSGGGYRAAGFHLGVLDMLNRLDLLRDISALSTVSGGTFTGMRYALSLRAGESFQTFFEKFKTDLQTIDIVDLALSKLAGSPPDIPSCRWDVITACASVYDQKFFGGKRFGVFWEHPPIPIKELIFNATEFRDAIAFRFQKSERPHAKIGNGKLSITPGQAQQLRLADIAAASSCFPGGFEPLSFPNDFDWPKTDDGANALKALQEKSWAPLPLMDGGVYDNQGMGSLFLGDRTEDEKDSAFRQYGLCLFSDSEPQDPDLYRLPQPRKPGWLKLWHLNAIWWFLLVLGLLTIGVTLRFALLQPHPWPELFRWLPLALPVCTVAVLILVRTKIATALCRVPEVKGSIWRFVKNLKVNQFVDMMELRITSLFALASNVFMRRIRRLVYSSVMNDPVLKNIVLPVSIYNLRIATKRPPPLDWLNPTEGMQCVSTKAETIPTTLWFTNREQLRDLIAAGQITVCRKLLVHLLWLHGNDPARIPEHQRPLFEAAHALFHKLRHDPYAFAGPAIQDDTGPHPS
jgi:predicted acylesterase/phospholipase RssA